MDDTKILFQECNVNGDCIYLLEINKNLKLFINSQKIDLSDGKAKELLQSLQLFLSEKNGTK